MRTVDEFPEAEEEHVVLLLLLLLWRCYEW